MQKNKVSLVLLVGWLMGAIAVQVAAQPPTIELSEVEIGDGRVEFEVGRGQSVPRTDLLPDLSIAGYALAVDRSAGAIEFKKEWATFVYRLYLTDLNVQEGSYLYLVTASPVGTFEDAIVESRVEIDGDTDAQKPLKLPVFSLAPPEFLAVEHRGPFEAHLGRRPEYRLTLRNQLDTLDVLVQLPAEVRGEEGVWDELGFGPASGKTVTIAPGASEVVILAGQPRSLGALRASLPPTLAGEIHDSVPLELKYQSSGGVERKAFLDIPVRFVPSFWWLALAVLGSSLVGCGVARVAFSPADRSKSSVGIFVIAPVLAGLTWLIALVMETRLQILQVELTPVEFLSVALFGFLIGLGGYRQLRLFRRFTDGGGQRAARMLGLVLFAASLLANAGDLSAQTSIQPIALATLSSGEVVVLDRGGGLVALEPETLELRTLVRSFRPYEPLDLAVGSTSSREVLLVSLVWPVSANDERNQVRAMDAEGQQIQTWNLRGSRVSGVAFDPRREEVYFAELLDRDVNRAELSSTRTTYARVGRILASRRLGDLAYDPARERVYVADPARGHVYAVGRTGREITRLAQDVGVTSALTMDGDRHRLLGLNVLNGLVWGVDLEDDDGTTFVVAELPEWSEPLGLAVGAKGEIWVGDAGNRSLYRFSRDGELKATLRLDDLTGE